MVGKTLFETLKQNAGARWQQAQDHAFVQALARGDLAQRKYVYYLKQDYAYLEGYSRAIALATAKAPALALLEQFAGLLHETLTLEMQLHRDYCAEFSINAEELTATEPAPVCQAYIDFCIAAAATGDSLDLLTALAPCGIGYGEIGARLIALPEMKPSHPYHKWAATYGGEEYQAYVRWMVQTLNKLGTGLPDERTAQLNRYFRLGCRYEWLFWEMAWREESWPL